MGEISIAVVEISVETFSIRRRETRVGAYAVALAVSAAGLAAVLLARGTRLNTPAWLLVGLIALAYVAERQSVRVTSHTESSVSVVPILFTAVLFGPLAGMVVGGCALMADSRA